MNSAGILPGVLVIAVTALMWGCGSAGKDAPAFDIASGKHPAGWVDADGGGHRMGFNADPSQCRQCHGSDILVPAGGGGIAGVGCSSTGFNGRTCHANGHVPRIAPHVIPFRDPALHGPAAKRDLLFCRGCHAVPFSGAPGGNPRFNAKIGSLLNGCEGCHNIGTAHPSSPPPDSAPWRGPVSHRDASNLAAACALCHGANLDGNGGVGPACSNCHSAASPLSAPNCTSCHGAPPSGAVFPNISGNHRAHNALNLVSGVCSTCHDKAGIGSAEHFNQAVNVAFSAAYNARSGAAAYDPETAACTNVSCHGGLTTPAWRGGTIDTDTQCDLCHRSRVQEPPEQFNSYFSGKHDFHVFIFGTVPTISPTCTQCHDTGKLAQGHFAGLNTAAFEQAPATTIRDAVNYSGGSCTPVNTPGNFSIGCHPAPPLTRVWATP